MALIKAKSWLLLSGRHALLRRWIKFRHCLHLLLLRGKCIIVIVLYSLLKRSLLLLLLLYRRGDKRSSFLNLSLFLSPDVLFQISQLFLK